MTVRTFDLAKLIAGVLTILLMVGVISFTAVWVGVILLLTQSELKWTWSA
jgi:hypothetical protein